MFKILSHSDLAVKCNEVIIKDPTTPQMRRYTTLWNLSVQ